MSFDVLATRANGRGHLTLHPGVVSQRLAEQWAHNAFEADHSLTMVWVTERGASVACEVFVRDPPGLGLQPQEGKSQ